MDEIINKDYRVSADNITMVDGCDHCTWRGIFLDYKKELELFGIVMGDVYENLTEGLLVIEGYPTGKEEEEFNIYVNGNSLKEAISNYVRYLKIRCVNEISIQLAVLDDFEKIEVIPSTFNIPLILLFNKELDLYFGKK